ncbi:hypothetical protein [Actinomadura litoris]|uniref:hypothetical protein n=1 Tax=Actinomadura litoris TaxID=2678616 RepID=UPI001FA6D2BC|nr:hypothetical protein [Actinomadura litoris]
MWGVWLHAGRWARYGWCPAFVPVVSLAPAAGPPRARAIVVLPPADFHPFLGSVMPMTVISAPGVPALASLDAAGLG